MELTFAQLNLLLKVVLVNRLNLNPTELVNEIIRREWTKIRDIANLLDCLADHKMTHTQAIQKAKDSLLTLANTKEGSSIDDKNKVIAGATARDCAQILSAFVRLDVIDGDTFDVL